MIQGNKPVDGGNLILSPDERDDLLEHYPELEPLIRPYIGSEEFINKGERYCLWLKDAQPQTYSKIPEIRRRLEAVRDTRLASPTKEFREYADMPTLFVQDRQPESNYLVVPHVSSERRAYVPIGYLQPSVIISNLVYALPDATLFDFALVTSQMHNAWMRTIAGRLESRYRYSPVVYNSFAYPSVDETQRAEIERLAQAVLDARANYPESSLADLYDPLTMPPDLLKAHKDLDKAVEHAYGVRFSGNEEKIVSHLFKLYSNRV